MQERRETCSLEWRTWSTSRKRQALRTRNSFVSWRHFMRFTECVLFRHRCSFVLVRALRSHGTELPFTFHEVRWGLPEDGILFCRWGHGPRRNSLRPDLRSFDVQASLPSIRWRREEGRNRRRGLHKPGAFHWKTHSSVWWLSGGLDLTVRLKTKTKFRWYKIL